MVEVTDGLITAAGVHWGTATTLERRLCSVPLYYFEYV